MPLVGGGRVAQSVERVSEEHETVVRLHSPYRQTQDRQRSIIDHMTNCGRVVHGFVPDSAIGLLLNRSIVFRSKGDLEMLTSMIESKLDQVERRIASQQ
jgi:hypothetical protein